MKYLLTLALALVALASTAQIVTNDTPTLTNNVQFVWGTNQAVQIKALWNEDFQTRLAAWTAATNANPGYASSNSVPTRPVFAVWAQDWSKPILAEQLALKDAQRQWRQQQALQSAYKAAQDLFANSWALLTPAQQATQSNVWWNAYHASQ